VIELFTANTPNGKKISIMCEEIGFDYKITKININKGEQLNQNLEN